MDDAKTIIKTISIPIIAILCVIFLIEKCFFSKTVWAAIENTQPLTANQQIQPSANKEKNITVYVNGTDYTFIPTFKVDRLTEKDGNTWYYPYPADSTVISSAVNALYYKLKDDTKLSERGFTLLTLALRDGLPVKVELPTEKLLARVSMAISSDNGSKNAILAAKAINGTILEPGDVFSFNEIVGERTADKGYLTSYSIYNNNWVPDVGGGVCRTATLLHQSVRSAGLHVIEHHVHSLNVSYAISGNDAAISWPDLDYQFKNVLDKSVRINCFVKDNKLTIEVWAIS